MTDFNEVDKENLPSEGKIKFNKKKKKYKNKFIIFTLVYLIIASLSGVFTAILLNYKTKEMNKEVLGNANNFLNEPKKHDESKYTELMEKLSKSVVSIIKVVGDSTRPVEVDSGSGVIFREGGYILTNNHVIDGAKVIKVKLYNDIIYDATVVGVNNTYDLAIIKIEAEDLQVMKVGSAVGLEYGHEILSIGNPLGKAFNENTKVGYVISASEPIITIDRTTGTHSAINVIKADVLPSSINSGGALCDTKGELVGINSIAMNHAKGTIKSSFYMTIEDAKPIINELLNQENSLRSLLGIYGEPAIPKTSEGVQGFYIKGVVRDSSAYEAGLRPTDIIVELNGKRIKSVKDVNECISAVKPGDVVQCTVFKNEEYKVIDIKVRDKK